MAESENRTQSLPEDMQKMVEELYRQREYFAAKPSIGERFNVPREGKDPVHVLLYRPDKAPEGPMPVLFNLHGGGWIGGDAMLMESFCTLMANRLGALVVNVNYIKAFDKPFPYAQNELHDTVLYFAQHAAEYSIDPARMIVGGHSAGAHISLGAAMLLAQEGFRLAGQMLVYLPADLSTRSKRSGTSRRNLDLLVFPNGGSDGPIASPLYAPDEMLRALPPSVMVICGIDELRPQGLGFAERLRALHMPLALREWPEAQHGFLEVNRPDYPRDERQTPEQAAMAREAEDWLTEELSKLLH